MQALERLERLPNLESLRLDYCVLPSPRALARLTAQCQSLRQLSTFFLRFSQVPSHRRRRAGAQICGRRLRA